MWFIYALAATFAWGAGGLFNKLGANERDPYSHLKIVIMVGLVMGAHAVYMLLFGDIGYEFINLLIYFPISFCYILSMAVSYFGLRYLELSVSSPVMNASGAVVSLMCFLILRQPIDALSAVSVVLMSGGIVALGILEKREQDSYEIGDARKYKIGFIAFFMPVIYCVLDSLGTFFDAWYLDDWQETPLRGVTEDTLENVANTSYELTFLIAAAVLLLWLWFCKKETIHIREEGNRIIAAVLETAGQFFYVFALSGNAVVSAPMIACFGVVSVVLSRIFLKEKLSTKQYITITVAFIGMALMGVAEGLAE